MTFAVIFVVVSLLTEWIRKAFGQTGVMVLAALVGATDIDPFVINLAQGGVSGMPIATLSGAIMIAASANNVAKGAYAVSFGGMRSARRPAFMLLCLGALRICRRRHLRPVMLDQRAAAVAHRSHAISFLRQRTAFFVSLRREACMLALRGNFGVPSAPISAGAAAMDSRRGRFRVRASRAPDPAGKRQACSVGSRCQRRSICHLPWGRRQFGRRPGPADRAATA